MDRRKLKKIIPPFFIRLGWTVFGWLVFICGLPKFLAQYSSFKSGLKKSGRRMQIRFRDLLPMLGEDTAATGFNRHYIYHPAWVARIVAKIKPQYHVDISFLITGSERLEILRPAMDHTLEHLANGGLSVRVIDASPRESAEQNRRNFGAVPGINPQYWQKGGFMVDAYLELLGNSGKKYFFTLFDDEPILNFTLELLRGVCRQTYPSMPWGPDSGGKFEGCNFGI